MSSKIDSNSSHAVSNTRKAPEVRAKVRSKDGGSGLSDWESHLNPLVPLTYRRRHHLQTQLTLKRRVLTKDILHHPKRRRS